MSTSSAFFSRGMNTVPWGPLGALLIAILAVGGGQLVVHSLVASGVMLRDGIDLGTAESLIQQDISLFFLFHLTTSTIMLGIVYKFVRYRGGSWSTLGFKEFSGYKALIVVVAGLVGYFLALGLVITSVGQFAPGIDFTAEQEIPFLNARNTMEIALAFLALVVIAPFSEEIVFRGMLLPAFSKKTGIVAAVIITSILFGLLHPPVNAMIVIGVFAPFLCWAYIYTKSIWPAIFLHSSKNLIAFAFLFMVGV